MRKPIWLLFAALVLSISGCERRDTVEFSSELSAEELAEIERERLGAALDTTEDGEASESAESPVDPIDAEKIQFVSANLNEPFRSVRARLFMAFVQDAGGPEVQFHDGQGSSMRQAAILNQIIEIAPPAIVICPTGGTEVDQLIADASAKGIPVVSVGGIGGADAAVTLAIDQAEIGRLAAQFVIQRLKIKMQMEEMSDLEGSIVEITGTDELVDPISQQRHAGFVEVIDRYPGVVLVHQAPGFWGEVGGAARAIEAAGIQKQANVVFAHNDAMGHGAYLGLKNQGVHGDFLVVGIDGIGGGSGGISKVRDQMLAATISVPLYSKQAADAAVALIAGDNPTVTEAAPELITIANAFQMLRKHTDLPFGIEASE